MTGDAFTQFVLLELKMHVLGSAQGVDATPKSAAADFSVHIFPDVGAGQFG